jgi:hypothetical protein
MHGKDKYPGDEEFRIEKVIVTAGSSERDERLIFEGKKNKIKNWLGVLTTKHAGVVMGGVKVFFKILHKVNGRWIDYS